MAAQVHQLADSSELVRLAAVRFAMSVWFATTNTRAALVHAAVPRCRGLIFNQDMSLDNLRQKVIFHNSVDVWIALRAEKNKEWTNVSDYKKFISFLLENQLNMKTFGLCAHEAGDDEAEKTKFAESLAESKDDPNSAIYTIKLNNTALELIRRFDST